MDSSNTTTSSINNYYNDQTLLSSSSCFNLPQPPPLPPPPPTSSSSSLFDPLSSYLPNFNPNPNTNHPQQPPPPPSSHPSSSSKKRSRASRRAPTTVLTTDTTNFRAMVQEFTGFSAPPFAPTSFLSRPFAQKITTSPSLVDAIAATAAANGNGPSFISSIHNPILGLPPQFGDIRGFVASEGINVSRSQEFGESGNDGRQDRQEKRQKTSDYVVESWISSSD